MIRAQSLAQQYLRTVRTVFVLVGVGVLALYAYQASAADAESRFTLTVAYVALTLWLGGCLYFAHRTVQKRFILPAVELVEHIQTCSGDEVAARNYRGRLQRVPGQWTPYFDQVSEVFDRVIAHQIALSQSVQDLRVANETAEAASEGKGEFLATMSHEIRTPLHGVLSMLELLQRTELGSKQRHFLETAARSGRSMLNIINDILDYSKIEAGKFKLLPGVVQLDRLLDDLGGEFAAMAHEKNIELIHWIDPQVPSTVLADEQRLRQILTNLLSNAVRFTDIGEITVRATFGAREPQPEGDDLGVIRFEVRDTGVGIPSEHLDSIFESFSQVDGSNTRRIDGTGLGLAIVTRLSGLMGGEVGVESELGKGTTFWFTVRVPILPSSIPIGRSDRELHGKRAMMAVVNPTLRKVLAELSQECGVEAIALEDMTSEQLVANTSGNPFDLVLLDAGITEGIASRLLTSLSQTDPPRRIPCIIIGSNKDSLGVDEIGGPGVGTFLYKPVSRSKLREAFQRVLVDGEMGPKSGPVQTLLGSLGGLRVLLAEDNPINQEVALAMLDEIECEVTLVGNGSEAVEACLHDRFDVVLLDCQMPIMDGYEAARRMRAHEQQSGDGVRVPIIALTANATAEGREACLESGMDDFLSKPYDTTKLYTFLERWSTGKGAADSRPVPLVKLAHTNVLDQERVDSLRQIQRNGEPMLLIRSVRLYLESHAEQIQAMRDSAGSNDRITLTRLAHTFKSSAASLGASKLALLCDQLEHFDHEAEGGEVFDLLAGIEAQNQLAVVALEALLGELVSEVAPTP